MTTVQAEALAREGLTMSRPTWRRSAAGNLWRNLGRFRLTVFRRGDGFAWCVATDGGQQYSRDTYTTEREAKAACWSRANE